MEIYNSISTIWINANPSFKCFNNPIINCISNNRPIYIWDYYQHQDEASSLNIALELLISYLESFSTPIHLIGHSTGGLIALLYARLYPDKVKSLTLLSVGFNPSLNWQSYYYCMRKLLNCSQEVVLMKMIKLLFGYQNRPNTLKLIRILKQDLINSPSNKSLFQNDKVPFGGVSMPLMIYGSENDKIIDAAGLKGWKDYLKKDDILFLEPLGHHFFHYFFPQKVTQKVIQFWDYVEEKQHNFDECLAI